MPKWSSATQVLKSKLVLKGNNTWKVVGRWAMKDNEVIVGSIWSVKSHSRSSRSPTMVLILTAWNWQCCSEHQKIISFHFGTIKIFIFRLGLYISKTFSWTGQRLNYNVVICIWCHVHHLHSHDLVTIVIDQTRSAQLSARLEVRNTNLIDKVTPPTSWPVIHVQVSSDEIFLNLRHWILL